MLSNIVLDELDWELERRGHRFVRYADEDKDAKRTLTFRDAQHEYVFTEVESAASTAP